MQEISLDSKKFLSTYKRDNPEIKNVEIKIAFMSLSIFLYEIYFAPIHLHKNAFYFYFLSLFLYWTICKYLF